MRSAVENYFHILIKKLSKVYIYREKKNIPTIVYFYVCYKNDLILIHKNTKNNEEVYEEKYLWEPF